jgi:hypothetical protein
MWTLIARLVHISILVNSVSEAVVGRLEKSHRETGRRGGGESLDPPNLPVSL